MNNMFRLLTRKLVQAPKVVVFANRWMSSPSVAATFAKAATPAATPTIEDLLVEITVVDPQGARRKIKGMVGTSFSCRYKGFFIGLKVHSPSIQNISSCVLRKDIVGNLFDA
jgi:hypothetical protein